MNKNLKSDFNEWYLSNIDPQLYQDIHWDDLPLEMQWGVIVDFFLSKNIVMDIQPVLHYDNFCYTEISFYEPSVILLNNPILHEIPSTHSLEEARKAAFEKAREIYDQQGPS